MDVWTMPPLTLYPDTALELPQPVGRKGQRSAPSALYVSDLMAEPDTRSGEWCPSIVRRLIASTCRPVAVGTFPAQTKGRLEAAGWLIVPEGAEVEEARMATWRHWSALQRQGIGYGCLRPKLVIVGDRKTRTNQYPFASRSGTWLWLALRRMGWDELGCFVLNAKSPDGRGRRERLRQTMDILQLGKPTILALGREAENELNKIGVEHFIPAQHPNHHKRWKHSEDVEGYVARLIGSGMIPGPWRAVSDDPADADPIPTHKVESLPELASPYSIRSIAYKIGSSLPIGPRTSSKHSGTTAKKRQQARAMFVTGESPTLREAAEAVGAGVDQIYEESRAGNWKAEREDFMRRAAEEKKLAALKAEKKATEDSRRLAWAATRLGLSRVVKKWQDPHSKDPSGFEVRAISAIAMSLSGMEQTDADGDVIRLSEVPIEELAKQVTDVMAGIVAKRRPSG